MDSHNMRAAKTNTEIRQDEIARAALALISRRGFQRLSMASVARAVGVVPSDIYRHYRNKDEVLDAVLELISRRLLGNAATAKAETSDALERLERMLMAHVKLIRSDVPIPRVVFSEAIFTGHRRRRKRVHRMFQEYLGEVADIIRAGQRAGRVRAGLAPDTLSVMFLGLAQPAAILWLMSGREFDVTEHAERAWQIFSEMIRADKSRPMSTPTKTATCGRARMLQ
jgi:TetR/AcrR family transcriptional regulator, fatty acid metabolism regulator protein